jgi:hypothetical protein
LRKRARESKQEEEVFFTYLKRSLIALAWLLLPVAAMLFCHALVNVEAPLWWDPISESQFGGEYWDDESVENFWIQTSGIVAFGMNLLFLIVIPSMFGGMDSVVKRKQFLAGLIANTVAGIGLAFFYFFMYGLDNLTMWAALLPLHLLAFPVTLIVGSRFVTPAYIKAFWF